MNKIIRINFFRQFSQRTIVRCKSESTNYIEKLEKESDVPYDVIDEEAIAKEAEIDKKRNKSRLKNNHYNILHELPPNDPPTLWIEGTVKYQRKLYGKFGASSNVSPALCWPTEKELNDKIEYEKVAYPFTIQEMVEDIKEKRKAEKEALEAQQKKIVETIKNLEKWKADLNKRLQQEEEKAMAAKRNKERLVDEVRKHFGYTVDPRSDKFKEMLEKKEKELKKTQKLAKKKLREEKMLEMLDKKSTSVKKANAVEEN